MLNRGLMPDVTDILKVKTGFAGGIITETPKPYGLHFVLISVCNKHLQIIKALKFKWWLYFALLKTHLYILDIFLIYI